MLDIDSLRKRYANSIQNTPTGRALGAALDEVERLREELDETRMAVGTYIDASIALTRERDEARWAVRYLLENITQLQTRADLWGLRKKLTWLTETD